MWVLFSMNFVDWLVGWVELHFCIYKKLLVSGDVGCLLVQFVEALRCKPEGRGFNS